MMKPPPIHVHDGIAVARDDLTPGGTKARYFTGLFDMHEHVVYASPCEGGAQTALAWAAREAGKRCTIFVAKRAEPHPRSIAAKRLGAQVVQVPNGYLNVVQSKAAEYCRRTGAFNLPFGGAILSAEGKIAEAARGIEGDFAEVWCAAGSGTLAKGLMRAWPGRRFVLVAVGRDVRPIANGVSHSIEVPKNKNGKPVPFGHASKAPCPFPSDPHYDRKAWARLIETYEPDQRKGILFWNVTGPAEDIL